MLNMKSAKKHEKGIALIFSLIFLSLLLVLALAFALDSMFSQKSAYNAANASSARFLAEAQLKQVITLIKLNQANFADGNLYSRDSSSSPVAHSDMLKDRLPVYNILKNTDSGLKPLTVNWNYIRNEADPDKRIVGRTAFIVVPDEKIPLDSLVDGRDALSGTPYPKHSEELDTETRIGKYVSEINVRAVIPKTVSVAGGPTSTKINNITRTLNWKVDVNVGFTDGKYTSAGWADFVTLFTALEDPPSAVALILADKAEFKKNLSLSVFKDPEAFWMDKNNNSKLDDNELFRRFDLTRNWNKNNWSDDLEFLKEELLFLDVTDSLGIAPTQVMQEWLEADDETTLTSGLSWLACFGYKIDGAVDGTLNGTFATTEDRRNQIAANLKDYCDNDDDDVDVHRPTSDVDPANWATGATVPTFTGNERTPYINKIGVKVVASQSEVFNYTAPGPPSQDYYDISASFEITPYVELINIYGTSWANDLDYTIYGTVMMTTTINGVDSVSTAYPFVSLNTTVLGTDDANPDWASSGYTNIVEGTTTTLSSSITLAIANRNVSVVADKIIITKVILHTKGIDKHGYDFVGTLDDNTEGLPISVFTGNNTTAAGTAWFGSAVHDPRQNLNSGDWMALSPTNTDDPTLVFSLTAGPPYGGVANADGPDPTKTPDTITDDADTETGLTDPAQPATVKLSTAFIRNAPMESPWELGFIHRGKMWQTINLKSYVPAKAIKLIDIGGKNYLAGGGTYAAGDANILDQIKMVPDAEGPQKINLNATEKEVFNALLAKVKYGCIIDSDMNVNSMAGINPLSGADLSGTALTIPYPPIGTSDAEIIGAAIIDKYKTTNENEIQTRASVVDQLFLTAATTDAAQEELIGKIINLTKMGRKTGTYTIIVIAQTIKDVGGTGVNKINIRKYASNETTEGNKDCEIGIFDAEITDVDPDKHIYYDDITAEQKIMVKCKVGSNFEIISFKYID